MKRRILTLTAIIFCVYGLGFAGEGFWETNGPYGGYINRVQYDCQTPGLCYAGGENGFFRSEDGGVTWRRSIPNLTASDSGVFCSRFCVSKALSGLVFARIGYFEESWPFFRSQDGGKTWAPLMTPWDGYVDDVACDPNDANHVCVALSVWTGTYNGGEVWESKSRGTSWNRIYEGVEVYAIAIDPSDSETIWIGCNYGFPKRTTDGGASWEDLGQGLLPGDCIYPRGMYVSPGDSSAVFFCSGYDYLYRWDESSYAWQAAGIDVTDICFWPGDPSKMFACDYSCLYSSDDGGASWQVRNVGVGGVFIDACPATVGEVLVGDLTAIWRSTDGCQNVNYSCDGLVAQEAEYLVACDAAKSVLVCAGYHLLARSADSGGTWELDHSFMDNYSLYLAQDPSDLKRLYATDSSDEIISFSDNSGQDWDVFCHFPFNVGWVDAITVDPTDSDTMFLGVNTSIYRTRDAGLSWDELPVFASTSEYGYIYSVAIDPSAPRRIFVCTSNGLYRSTDDGQSFERTSSVHAEPAFVEFDPNDPRSVYAGDSSSGGLYRSSDSGDSWERLDTPVDSVYDMAINPSDSNDFYISGYMGVHHTRDGGNTWTSLSTEGLECTNIEAIVVDFGEAGNTIYAAGAAVFSFLDPLTPFVSLSTSQAKYYVGDTLRLALDLSNPGGELFADLAAAIELPDKTLVYLPSLWMDYSPYYSGWIPGHFDLKDYTLLEAPLDAGLPSGIYYAYAALFEQGTTTYMSNLAVEHFRFIKGTR
ncbi:MAG TPA: hypothetical protein VM163_02265 [bacterium]|nr:hypothetical protein [bacterium]